MRAVIGILLLCGLGVVSFFDAAPLKSALRVSVPVKSAEAKTAGPDSEPAAEPSESALPELQFATLATRVVPSADEPFDPPGEAVPAAAAGAGSETIMMAEPAGDTARSLSESSGGPDPDDDAAALALPQLSHDELCNTLAETAQKHDLPVAFFSNLIWQESRFKPHVVSRAGAQGVAQFMPKVARSMGLSNPFNPLEAIPAAARFLRSLFQEFGNFGLAAAAYNAGPTRVNRWLAKGGRLPGETRSYVLKITGRPAEGWRGYRTETFAYGLTPRMPCRRTGGAFADIDEASPVKDDAEQLQVADKRKTVTAAKLSKRHGPRARHLHTRARVASATTSVPVRKARIHRKR